MAAELECNHDFINRTGTCTSCGITMTAWNSKNGVIRGPVSKSKERSILPDLETYSYPDDIKNEANEIWIKIGMPVKRSKERDKMLFFLVYTAFRNKGHFVVPQKLARDMGLTTADINKALNNFSEIHTGYRPTYAKTSPVDLLPEMCSWFGLDHIKDDVITLAKDILEKEPAIGEEFPHKVAAGILKYYTEINGIELPVDKFNREVDFSGVTIKDIYERVARIHNK